MRIRKEAKVLLVGLAIVAILGAQANALDLYADPLPQAQLNDCQSYAMMLALAAQGDPEFPINNFDELRNAEMSFRQLAESIPGGPYGHAALQIAVDKYTGGKYKLAIEGRADLVDWMARVKELTILESSTDVMIADLTGTSFPVVITSVTRFGESDYRPGSHILTILGVSGSGLNSATQLVAFNSAIKGGGAINQCEPGTQPGDMRYTAGVVSTNDYELKTFSDGYDILYLSKN